MSLDRRLTLLFILVVILPMVAAGFVFQRVVNDEIKRRAVLSLQPTLSVALDVHNERVEGLDRHVADAASSASIGRLLKNGPSRQMNRALELQRDQQGLDFLVASGAAGNVLGARRVEPRFVDGFEVATPREIVAAASAVRDGFVVSAPKGVTVDGRRVGELVGGLWIDDEVLIGSTPQRVELAVVVGEELVASSQPIQRPLPLGQPAAGRFDIGVAGGGPALAQPVGGNTSLIAWAPRTPLRDLVGRIVGPLVLLLLVAASCMSLLVYLLSRWVMRPIGELSQRAKAIAEGDFDERIRIRAKGEVGGLAASFNEMSARLSEMIQELSSSRAQLQRAVERVGETLRSTHNMDQLLDSLLNTAADAVEGDAAVLWRFSPNRRELLVAATRGVDLDGATLPVGTGVAGLVAERGAPVTRHSDAGAARSPVEPAFAMVVAAPIYSQGRMQAVMSVYRTDRDRPFSKNDVDTVLFLAEQGGVAIENVTLHEEAQRLSLTDGLTGVWNRRYFQMHFRQTLATAVRFERPFSVLIMDLDHFKRVNDTHGHQRGDAVLVEFAQRVNDVLREVDTFARYGGEEFVCLLSETDFSGAVTTAEKIIDTVSSEAFGEPGEEPVRLTVSIGVSSYPQHGASFSALVEAADQALYEAKQAGRDRVVVAGGHPPNLSIAR
jgi:diguanylate cyclase (GGDEF)-like protein